MAFDLEAIQQGFASSVSGISGLQALPALHGVINPPTFAVTEFELEYHKTYSATRGLTEMVFTCGVFASDSEQGRKLLMPLLSNDGATSVVAAIESDKTLAGSCKTLKVEKVRGAYRLYDVGDSSYIGAMIDVRVWA